MALREQCLSTKIVNILILMCLLTVTTLVVFVFISEQNPVQNVHRSKRELPANILDSIINSEFQDKQSNCEIVHIGIVYTGYMPNYYFYTMLKSLYFYRNNPLHLHIIVDDTSQQIVQTMFDTWDVPQVTVNFYHINNSVSDLWWMPKNQNYPEISEILKLTFPKVIPSEITTKIIVVDPDVTFTSDVYKLWNLFNDFSKDQALGLIENQGYLSLDSSVKQRRFKTNVMLYNLESLKTIEWDKIWTKFVIEAAARFGEAKLPNLDILNTVANENKDLIHRISCQWHTELDDQNDKCFNNNKFKIMQWRSPNMWNIHQKLEDYYRLLYNLFLDYSGNLLRRRLHGCEESSSDFDIDKNFTTDECSDLLDVQVRKFRKLLYLREFKYTPTKDDVTFVSQLTFDRLHIVEELSNLWEGPISLTFYVTDAELQKCMQFIETSETLKSRSNIAYHVVFKEGTDHPINELRNVALRNVVTPYVFLNDMDFIPVKGSYSKFKKYIGQMSSMEKIALVVAAFETKNEFAVTKMDLLHLLDKEVVLPILFNDYFKAHKPTDYTQWRSAETPYKVKWEPEYEPYVIVQSNVTSYDRRFFGFGFDKVSHILELYKQGYEFIVLPDVFTIHKSHPMSNDKVKYLNSDTYRKCLDDRIKIFIEELDQKYGPSPISRRSSEMQYIPSNSTD